MNLEPTNRYILVKPIEEKKEETNSMIMLPSDYKKQEAPHLPCSVVDVAEDSKFFNVYKKDDILIVERRMLEKIELQGNEFYLVLENYVVGRLK